MNPAIQSLADVPRLHGRERPGHPALVFEGRATSWADFDRHASRVANGLAEARIGAGDLVAYLGKNTDAYFELLFGSAKAGSCLAVLNWRLADPELAWLIEDTGTRLLFVEREFVPVLQRIRGSLERLEQVIAVGGSDGELPDYERWRDSHSDRDPGTRPPLDAPQVQLYTSGTTGRPKGAQLSNRSLLASLELLERSGQDFTRIEPDDANVVHLPIFHIGATGFAFDHLYYGVTQVVLRQFATEPFLDCLARHPVRRTCLAPTMIQMVLDDPACSPRCFEKLEYLIYGGSPIGGELLRRALDVMGCGFVQQYGMTESTGLATFLPPEDHDPAGNPRMTSAGRPYRDIALRIVDRDGKELGVGETGEICIQSPCLMEGYWRRPDATEETLGGGWLHTGDAGYLDADGYLFLQDRIKDMIVSGAENIYPAEVENAIADHPEVRMVAVVGVPDERWGEAVKAVVVREPGSNVGEREIIDWALARIARYKRPRSVDFVDEIPVNPSGKILRRLVRERYWQGHERRIG